jgi:hypothetical protein
VSSRAQRPAFSIIIQRGNQMDKKALIDAVIEQILIDIGNHDLTAIEELLDSAPEQALQGFLSDIPQAQRWSVAAG